MNRVRAAVVTATDVGRKRSQNEDSHLVWIPENPEEREQRGILLVVADGMGGALAGEIASRLAAETVVRRYREGNGEDPLADLRLAVEDANRVVYEMSRTDPALHGMGTTCTALAVRDRDAWIAHVGDSRAYLDRGASFRQLTQDHTLVAELVERNQIRPEDARTDARRNVVTRSIGVGERVEVDAFALQDLLDPGDTLLLCSDGLYGPLTDAELAETIQERSLDEACQVLIGLANDVGGPDNITVILARIEIVADAVSTPSYRGPERRRATPPPYDGPERRRATYSGPERRRASPSAYDGPERRRGTHGAPSPETHARGRRRSRLVLVLLAALALALAAWSIVWLIGGRNESHVLGRLGLKAAVEARG